MEITAEEHRAMKLVVAVENLASRISTANARVALVNLRARKKGKQSDDKNYNHYIAAIEHMRQAAEELRKVVPSLKGKG